MEITQSSNEDVEAILALYDEATALQASKGMTQWPKIDRSLIETEVDEGRQWKMMEQGQIVCVWLWPLKTLKFGVKGKTNRRFLFTESPTIRFTGVKASLEK